MNVSIITTTLNSEKYIEGCLLSALAQGSPDFDVEHVIIDGQSTDKTLSILTRYQRQFPLRVRVYSAKDNGPGDAWNKGMRLATGDIFGWLGSDDLLYPGALRNIISFFRAKPAAMFVYGECDLVDVAGRFMSHYPTEEFDYKRLLNKSCYIPCTSAYFRREVFDMCGLINSANSDYDYWLRVGKIFPLHYLRGEVLSQFRVHEGGISSARATRYKMLKRSYLDSRAHGGSLFSNWSIMYHTLPLVMLADRVGVGSLLRRLYYITLGRQAT